jgi:O-antigen/teichoic acid export membrane protein
MIEADPAASGGSLTAPGPDQRQIRGSVLLLVGRMIDLGVGLLVQVLIVRYLLRADYGAFSYAVALVAFGRVVISLGHKRAVSRYLAVYDAQHDYPRLFGVFALIFGSVLGTSLVLFAVLFLARNDLAGAVVNHPDAVTLLLVLSVLAPTQALDDIFQGAFAVFSRPSAIFIRKYVFAPAAQLIVVVLLILSASGVIFLAGGYVAAGIFGLLLDVALLNKILRERDLYRHLDLRRLILPAREFFGFSIPMMTTELLHVSMLSVSVAILGYFATASDVAGLRAIYPAAALNQIVAAQFGLLFTPVAARLVSDMRRDEMEETYWHTAAWVAVLTFPILVATVPLAGITTVVLYGERYQDAAPYLAILSLGMYANVATGFNGLTLAIHGRLRLLVIVNLICTAFHIALSLALIPGFGPLGAAIANCSALLLQNVLLQWSLRRDLGFSALGGPYRRVYVTMGLALAAYSLFLWAVHVPHLLAILLGIAISAAILIAYRGVLRIGATVPEIARLPIIRRFVS